MKIMARTNAATDDRFTGNTGCLYKEIGLFYPLKRN